MTTAQLIYCKTRTDYTYKLRVQDFATGKNFSFNQYPKQRFLLFSRESYFRKSIWNLCPVGWKKYLLDSRKPSTSSRICITASNSSFTSYLSVTTVYKETHEFARISAPAPINIFL